MLTKKDIPKISIHQYGKTQKTKYFMELII